MSIYRPHLLAALVQCLSPHMTLWVFHPHISFSTAHHCKHNTYLLSETYDTNWEKQWHKLLINSLEILYYLHFIALLNTHCHNFNKKGQSPLPVPFILLPFILIPPMHPFLDILSFSAFQFHTATFLSLPVSYPNQISHFPSHSTGVMGTKSHSCSKLHKMTAFLHYNQGPWGTVGYSHQTLWPYWCW
jgi:hypothetical protein